MPRAYRSCRSPPFWATPTPHLHCARIPTLLRSLGARRPTRSVPPCLARCKPEETCSSEQKQYAFQVTGEPVQQRVGVRTARPPTTRFGARRSTQSDRYRSNVSLTELPLAAACADASFA